MHVTIDGFHGDPQKLADENLVREVLDQYPGRIGMTKISAPYVCRYIGEKPEDWGVSGFVLIAESHISIHTFPDHRYIWVDIFSCKGFDATQAINDMKREFDLGDVTVRVLERGLEYPHHVAAAVPLALRERQEVTASIGEQSG